jgi:hypothetical protein
VAAVRKFCLLFLGFAVVSSVASAESETANSFDMLGWDSKTHRVYLRDCHNQNGPWELWTVDFSQPQKPHIEVSPLKQKDDVPMGLTLVKSVDLSEVDMKGSILGQKLDRASNSLVQRYDLRLILQWKGTRTVSDFITYRTPEMQLMEVFQLESTSCALAVVSWNALLTGIRKQRALLMCPDDRKVPFKK